MKQLILIFITYTLSGCGSVYPEIESKPCKPVPCTKQECFYPKIPTFKPPPSRSIKPISVNDLNGTCIMNIDDVIELSKNNSILRDINWKNTAIAIRINNEFNND